MDILSYCLETFKVLDLVHAVTSLFDQIGVNDDAVALIAVTDRNELSCLIIEVVCVC